MYLGYQVSAIRCDSAVTARPRFVWVRFRECCELLYGKLFPLKLNGFVCKSYVMSAILYERDVWCLKENDLKHLRWTFAREGVLSEFAVC